MDEQTAVVHEPQKHRYVLHKDGEEAGFAEYRIVDDQRSGKEIRDFNHTVVDPKFRGQGLSAPLIEYALNDTRSDDFKVRASCSAVQNFLNKNPEFQDMISE